MSFIRYARRTAALASFVCLAVAKPIFAAEINVPAEQPTVQAAVNAASPGDVIRVSPGSYVGSLQFQGKDLRIESTEGPEVTTIQGNGGTAVDIGPSAALVGFTVTGGANYFGGGMAVHGEGTLIKGNIFERNLQFSGGFGAAIAVNNASPIIERNVFRFNSAGGDTQYLTGTIGLINFSSPRIINNLFYDNDCRALNITVPSTLPCRKAPTPKSSTTPSCATPWESMWTRAFRQRATSTVTT